MQQLEQLRSRLRVLEDLQVVVRTMKAMAQVAVRRYESVRESLQDYGGNVDLALHAFLQDRRFRETPDLPPFLAAAHAPAGRVGVILFGSDHGLCGSFNERILERHGEMPRRRGFERRRRRHAVVGLRLAALLTAAGDAGERSFRLPLAVEGVTRLIQELMLLIEEWRFGPEPPDQILLVHHRVVGAARSELVERQLLPLERARLQRFWEQPWDSAARPMLFGDEGELFRTIVRELLTVSLHRAVIESLASEHAARLAAMHAAERNLEDRLGDLTLAYRQERQNAITSELLDVVAGFEALRNEE
jgi:F-type H+-transporting ATPase subunit gamma